MTHALARYGLVTAALFCVPALAPAQVKEPPRTEKVKLDIRYRIRADRDERVRQYLDLQKFLTNLGFEDTRKNEPDYDLEILDSSAERFTGTIPSAKVLDVLNNPRVLNILFAPDGFVLPAEADKPIAIKLGLRNDYVPLTQQKLHRQVVAQLASMGFAEALGYDTQGYSLVRGTIQAKSVPLLVRDLRTEPSGWFLPLVRPEQLPSPLRDRNPVRWAEVLPIADVTVPFTPAPVVSAQLRYSADLRAVLSNAAAKNAPLRVEVIFENRITDPDAVRTLFLGRFPGASVDGIIGNIVHVRLPRASYVEGISQEPGVLGVRLPRQGAETIVNAATGKSTTPAEAIKAARLDELHKRGYTGAGVKVVLIGSDFTGADKLIGTELPKRTKIIDFTTELTPELLPFPADPLRAGTGTTAAKALAAVAPDADLILVRIDPGCFFHLNAVIRLTRGEIQYTDALLVRLNELANRTKTFDTDRAQAVAAYKAAFSDLTDNEVAVAARKKAKADLDGFIQKEKELVELTDRFNNYQKDITKGLEGAQVIVNTLVWESGYPLDAISDFAGIVDRLATDLPPRIVKPLTPHKPPLVWVQSASAAGASVWGGPFLDANRDGLMEFVPPKTKLPADNWSPSLNFLGIRAANGSVAPELAAGAKLRFTVQWREPADPNFPEADIPVRPLTIRVLRQIDPNGEKRSSDEMAEDARSVNVPNVIYRTPTFLVFEQMLEFTVPAAGRFALALDSAAAAEPLLPALQREVEIYPRIVIETLGTSASDPKVVFRSYTAPTAGVGTPGDALGAITVGTDAPGVLVGGGTGLTLRGKPDVLGPNTLALGAQTASGPGVATAFAGGASVLLLQARVAGPNVLAATGIEPGKKLELPERWLKIVPSIAKRRE